MRFLRFSVRQAFQGLWRNRVMNVAATVTMVLMLLLLSALIILVSGVEAGLRFIESKVEVRAELHEGVLAERVADLEARLAGLPEVATVDPREQGAGAGRLQRSARRARRDEPGRPVRGLQPVPGVPACGAARSATVCRARSRPCSTLRPAL